MPEMSETVTAAAAEIYGVAPEQFTAERKKHVDAAKKGGDTDAARTIQSFGKPTRAAWILNQLARAEPDLLTGLSGLAVSLREAQDALDGERIRELSAQRRRTIDEIARAAYRVTDEAPSAAVRDEVAGTITAALLDPQVLTALRSGTLVRAAEASGFGGPVGPGLAAVPDLPAPSAPLEAVPSAEPGATKKQAARKKAAKSAAKADSRRTDAGSAADNRRARLAAEREERKRAQQAEREQRRAAAAEAYEAAQQAESDQRAAVRMLAEQLADARRVLGERELDARRAKHALARAERK